MPWTSAAGAPLSSSWQPGSSVTLASFFLRAMRGPPTFSKSASQPCSGAQRLEDAEHAALVRQRREVRSVHAELLGLGADARHVAGARRIVEDRHEVVVRADERVVV